MQGKDQLQDVLKISLKHTEAATCLAKAFHRKSGNPSAPFHQASEELLKLGKAAVALKLSAEGSKA